MDDFDFVEDDGSSCACVFDIVDSDTAAHAVASAAKPHVASYSSAVAARWAKKQPRICF